MSIPVTMRGVLAPDTPGSAGLQISEIAVPECGAQHVLIKVAASGINRPDILQRDGLYPAPKGHSAVLGLEVAGEIVAVGAEVRGIQIGDHVTALVNGGGYGEFCLANGGAVLPLPSTLSLIEAAGLPETVFTVWHNVFQRGKLMSGEWFLVHGGTSGIGTIAIQLAKAFGAKVIATAGSDAKCDAIRALGADVAINYKAEDFVEVVKEKTEGHGIDVTLDMVGGDYIARNISAAAMDGRIVQIAFLAGAKQTVNFTPLMMKRLTLTGSTLRARSDQFKAALASEVKAKIWPLIEQGVVKPQIDKVFPFEDVRAAHECMEASGHIGKIILKLA